MKTHFHFTIDRQIRDLDPIKQDVEEVKSRIHHIHIISRSTVSVSQE
jgi:hypothetical protein